MKPRSLASSHTGRRGQDVRQASITSAYGRGLGPIHSSRLRIKASTGFDTAASFRSDRMTQYISLGPLLATQRRKLPAGPPAVSFGVSENHMTTRRWSVLLGVATAPIYSSPKN